HLRSVRLFDLPDRRVLAAGRDTELLDHDPEGAVVDGDRLVQRQGRGPEPAAAAGTAVVRAWELHPGRQVDVLVDAGDGDARGGDVPRRRGGGVAVPQAKARHDAVVPVDRSGDDVVPVHRRDRRVD